MNKASSKIYLDSSLFKALVDETDDFHRKAQTIWEKLLKEKVQLTTSNYILDETFTLIRIKCGLDKAKKLRIILSGYADNLAIKRVTARDEARAWDWFIKEWSGLSFTDCVSFALMKRLDFDRVATFDDHFSRAGFQIES